MTHFIVIKPYNDAPESPIRVERGERLAWVEESNPQGDWANWVFCRGEGKEGWVPKQILTKDAKEAVVTEDYHAKEHNLVLGERLVAHAFLNGWLWGHKVSDPTVLAWAPMNHLAESNDDK